ncbi:MAG: hypothetical protein GY943_36815 [Chloroflexi bacterium]|nr:hypothetical protein [Chloroflexota bacterium]
MTRQTSRKPSRKTEVRDDTKSDRVAKKQARGGNYFASFFLAKKAGANQQQARHGVRNHRKKHGRWHKAMSNRYGESYWNREDDED